MAKTGTASKVGVRGSTRSAGTRRKLVEAAVETLKADGYAGASARAIADRAGLNQALVFYHFGSVADLLLAALDAVGAERLDRYAEAVNSVASLSDLVEVAATIFREDLDTGSVTVLTEMIAGVSSTPGLGPEVAARVQPWVGFAEQAVERNLSQSGFGAFMPARDLAYCIVALYLGLETLSHLDGDRGPALNLFSHAGRLAHFAETMSVPPPGGSTA